VIIIKDRTLDIILTKIKKTRKRVEKINTAFTRQFQFKPNYKDSNYKTIHLDKLQFQDLSLVEI